MNRKTFFQISFISKILVIFFFVSSSLNQFALSAENQIAWIADFEMALLQAGTSKRPLFIHFYGDNCPPCRLMEANVFTDSQIIARMNQNFVAIKINVMEQPALAKKYLVKAIPTDVILKPDGQLIHRRQGGITQDRFAEYLAYLLYSMQNETAKQVPLPTPAISEPKTASPFANVPPTTNPAPAIPIVPVDSNFVTTPTPAVPPTLPPATNSFPVSTALQQPATENLVAQPVPPVHEITNQSVVKTEPLRDPFTKQPVIPQPQPVSPFTNSITPTVNSVNPPVPNPVVNPVSTPPAVNITNLVDNKGVVPETTTSQVFNTPTQPSYPTPVQTPLQTMLPTQPTLPPPATSPVPAIAAVTVPTPTAVTNSMQAVKEPLPTDVITTGNEEEQTTMVEVPLGLEGYCPVVLCTQERWVPGNPAYYTIFRGHVFRFSSEEAMAEFMKFPAKYAPVAMGEDIVQMVDRNKKVYGNRKFGAWFQGRVFLFSNQDTLDAFAARPEYYSEIALKYETAFKGPLGRF